MTVFVFLKLKSCGCDVLSSVHQVSRQLCHGKRSFNSEKKQGQLALCQRFIYENKDKKNRLMRIDELHKFSVGTLDDVRTVLNDRLKGIRMEYLPETFWNHRDKANARAMIQAIDKRLKTRRIMRSLERFVGGRPYGGDLRLLQRTI
ncbi:hypothetical protein Tco_1086441 [Tanacetum coccineum]